MYQNQVCDLLNVSSIEGSNIMCMLSVQNLYGNYIVKILWESYAIHKAHFI